MVKNKIKNIYVEWEEFGEIIERLVIILRNKRFDSVFGIPRGGIIPAAIIARKLDLPLVLYPGKNTLVVDDVNETGESLEEYSGCKNCVLFTTRWSRIEPDYYGKYKTNRNSWLIMPWENEDELK